jgi:hypothetical protein
MRGGGVRGVGCGESGEERAEPSQNTITLAETSVGVHLDHPGSSPLRRKFGCLFSY